ncbi:MAG TPA: N-acetylmuramoyl-L-alanine amidase [Clostridiaceae bacterium]|nr:N-acetylmuramoyl-L-alanine amidase [Clostridiaceae bacterium]
MTGKRSARIVLVLLIISSILLLLSFVGVLPKPVRGAKRFQIAGSLPDGFKRGDRQPAESLPADEQPPPQPSSSEAHKTEDTEATELPSKTAAIEKIDLPITDNDPDKLPPGVHALRTWPSTLSVPKLHDANLEEYKTRSAAAQPLKGVTVILDASHGGEMTGAVWGSGEEALMEKVLLLSIATEAEKALTRFGATVVLTRTTDEAYSLFARVAIAADVALMRYREATDQAGYLTSVVDNLRLLMGDVIRINQDSPASGGRGLFGTIGTSPQLRILYDIEAQYSDIILINLSLGSDDDSSRRGSSTYYMSADYVASTNNGYAVGQDPKDFHPNYTNINSAGRASLAELLKTNLTRMVPSLKPENGLDAGEEKDLALLRLTNYVSASLVPGYLSNEGDRAILASEQGRADIGQAIANAVFQYFIAPTS